MTNYVDPERFAHAVVDVVEELRWGRRIGSVRKLATASGMTHTYLNARMNKTTPMNVEDVARLAAALEVSPDEIVSRAYEAAMSADAPTFPRVAKTSREAAGAPEED